MTQKLEIQDVENLKELQKEQQITSEGFVVSPSSLFQLLLGVLSIAQFQRMSVPQMRKKCIENEGLIKAYLEEYLVEGQNAKRQE